MNKLAHVQNFQNICQRFGCNHRVFHENRLWRSELLNY